MKSILKKVAWLVLAALALAAFGCKTDTEKEYVFIDTGGNKRGTPVAGEPLKIALTASVPQENGYTGNKSNTKVTVTANITTASKVKKSSLEKRRFTYCKNTSCRRKCSCCNRNRRQCSVDI